jgi:GTP-binding protein HflX
VNIGFDVPEGSTGIVVIPKIKSDPTIRKSDVFNGETKIRSTEEISNPTYYIGRGKVEIIAEFIIENGPLELAVFDCPLKPNQVFNLETRFGLRVLDRSTLILMIFLHHARTKEAKLQVEYAILKHQIPYVTELVRRSKKGEHPGFMAGGEYKVDEYFRLTKTRIKTIRKELAKIKTSRTQQRKHRRRRGFVLVSFAGYTNAGKSSLLKTLTDARVIINDQMFSTVTPKTRRFRDSKVLFTDTVGFIREIPTQLIEAFKSTLEEIIDADHIFLVVDISENIEIIQSKLNTCTNTIEQLITERYPSLGDFAGELNLELDTRPRYHLILNKCDLDSNFKNKANEVLKNVGDKLPSTAGSSVFFTSCKTKYGLEILSDKLTQLEPEQPI